LREAALAVAAGATDGLAADLIECLNPTAPIGAAVAAAPSDFQTANCSAVRGGEINHRRGAGC